MYLTVQGDFEVFFPTWLEETGCTTSAQNKHRQSYYIFGQDELRLLSAKSEESVKKKNEKEAGEATHYADKKTPATEESVT